MKLSNIMKLSNNTKNLIKIAIIIFILLSCIYVLYIFNNGYKTTENLSNIKDCSNCTVRPSSGKCVPLYDISHVYTEIGTTNKYRLDICNIITNNIFCPWESQCLFDNIASVEQRSALTNSNINQSIYDITCCSGSSFYDNSNINFNFNAIIDNSLNIDSCSTIKTYIRRSISGEIDLSYDSVSLNAAYNICNTLEPTGQLFNKKGMLFSKTESSFNIFTDPKTMPSDIISYISFSNIRNEIRGIINRTKIPIIEPTELAGFDDISLNNLIVQLTQLNDALTFKARNENLQRQLNRTDLTAAQNVSFDAILIKLRDIYRIVIPSALLEDRKNFTYRLVNNSKAGTDYSPYTPSPLNALNPNQYLLNSEQFFNCIGEVKDSSGSFTPAQLTDFSVNDYFGTSGRPVAQGGLGQAPYSALGSIQNTGFPSNNDLEMELRRLETIPSTGNAPVSVISSYLNAINSFYEKQITNLSGPREHSYNQQLLFDNNSLETKQPSFFTYNKDVNNVYDCKPSILGNTKFEYCGPEAYYESPTF